MAMSPEEVAYRFGAAARDRFAPQAWTRWSAREAADRLIDSDGADTARALWASVAHLPSADACAGTLAGAQRLAEGHWTLFGRDVKLGDPPRWDVDPSSGVAWPDLPSARIDYRQGPQGSGAKSVWEAGRLTFLPTLALAARLSGDPRHAERARRWLADFIEKNPLGRGIHHTSGIEMAIRVMTIGWTLALLDGVPVGSSANGDGRDGSADRAAVSQGARGFMAQQALWCRSHLSIGSSANNHLLAEYAAMVVAGAGIPGWSEGERLVSEGMRGLEHELLQQIHGDGVTAEQSFRYLPFVWELVVPALIIGERAGHRLSDRARMRLSQSLEFARSMRRSNGTLPPVGDEDDARILLADQTETRLDLAGNLLAAWLGVPAIADGASALTMLLMGLAAPPSARASEGLREFKEGGHTVWRHRETFATLDHGPLGLGQLAAHGHADALSLTLRHGNDDLIVDPGTLAYFEDERARVLTRATASHSTVNFGGRSQSEMLGAFLWGRRARLIEDRGGWWCDWWTGERHWRRVTFGPADLIIQDESIGSSPEIVFALAPGADVRLQGSRALVTAANSVARFESEGVDGWRVEHAECAPSYGQRWPSLKLVANMPDERCRTIVRFGPK